MNHNERINIIEAYGTVYPLLEDALARFPRNMWEYRPEPKRWTIHEIIVHLADSEANSYIRCRRFIAEPGSSVLGYDESLWARALHYQNLDPDTYLGLFKWLRRASYLLIKDLPAATWANTVVHSQNGLMTMDDWLITYERHVRDHIAQMQAVHADWLNRKV